MKWQVLACLLVPIATYIFGYVVGRLRRRFYLNRYGLSLLLARAEAGRSSGVQDKGKGRGAKSGSHDEPDLHHARDSSEPSGCRCRPGFF